MCVCVHLLYNNFSQFVLFLISLSRFQQQIAMLALCVWQVRVLSQGRKKFTTCQASLCVCVCVYATATKHLSASL